MRWGGGGGWVKEPRKTYADRRRWSVSRFPNDEFGVGWAGTMSGPSRPFRGEGTTDKVSETSVWGLRRVQKLLTIGEGFSG
jgi:hypothetical protein